MPTVSDHPASIPFIGFPAVLTRILFAKRVERTEAGTFQALSTPGHLLHLVERGEVSQLAGGHKEILRAGTLVWYHDCEPVTGRIHQVPWRFLSIGFLAPDLLPPPGNQRVLLLRPATAARLGKLLRVWDDSTLPELARSFCCLALLNEVLGEVAGPAQVRTIGPGPAGAASRWFELENRLRERMDDIPTLARMAALAGTDVRTLTRSCHAASGLPPMQRLKQLRLRRAVFLLQLTDQTITEIAFSTGYERVQEFSREMAKTFGASPSEIRRSGLQI